jgi:hypothetical protein
MLSRVSLYNRIDEALGDDPRAALIAVRRLLTEELPWIEVRAVRMARSKGYPWARIGRALGRSRQAIQRRYADVEHTWPPIPREPEGRAERQERAIAAIYRNADRRKAQAAWEAQGGDIVPW